MTLKEIQDELASIDKLLNQEGTPLAVVTYLNARQKALVALLPKHSAPPFTNMTPLEFSECGDDDVPLSREMQNKQIHVSSGDKEWAIISYYKADSGHMCIDIEEI